MGGKLDASSHGYHGEHSGEEQHFDHARHDWTAAWIFKTRDGAAAAAPDLIDGELYDLLFPSIWSLCMQRIEPPCSHA